MRNPIRSETDAFRMTVGAAVLVAASVALGALTEPVIGVALLVGILVVALVWDVSSTDPQRRRPLREAASEAVPAEPSSGPRVLVVANRTLHGDELRTQLLGRARAGARVRVVVPIVTSRVHYIASDVDQELEEARERLAALLSWARMEGIAVTGRVGDANAALGAIEDELRLFGADEVIISTYPHGRSNWLETGIVERLHEELDVPVTHVVLDPDRVPAAERA